MTAAARGRVGVGGLALLASLPMVTTRPAAAAQPTCPPSEPTEGVGLVDPFRPPASEATALNAAAKPLYRQGKWDEARATYHAAEIADPAFLAPALNIACAFVRQERFVEATDQVIRLLDRAFVPWSREILTAADLGALKAQPQMARIRQALAEGAHRWGADLETDLLFVARQHEPLKLPLLPLPPTDTSPATAPVVLVLGLHQEVFAWSPRTARYRQITAEDGRVLAMAQSMDHRILLYVTAEKLVRRPQGLPALRGLSLHTLTLATMAPAVAVPLEGDVVRLAIAPTASGFALAIGGDKVHGTFTLAGAGTPAQLIPVRPLDERHQGNRLVVLTAGGVTAARERPLAIAGTTAAGSCRLLARQIRRRDGIPTIEIAATGDQDRRAPVILTPRFGAGLAGLSIP